jgi:hypothetical protein
VQHLDAGLSWPGHDILGGRDDLGVRVECWVKPSPFLRRDADDIKRCRTGDHHADHGPRCHLVGTQF